MQPRLAMRMLLRASMFRANALSDGAAQMAAITADASGACRCRWFLRSRIADRGVLFSAALLFLAIAAPFASGKPADGDSHASNSSAAPTAIVESVVVDQTGPQTRVIIKGQGQLSCRVTRLSDPERIVLDFDGARLGQVRKALPANAEPVRGVRLSQVAPDVTRVVIDLSEKAEFKVEQRGDQVALNFVSSSSQAAPSATIAEPPTANAEPEPDPAPSADDANKKPQKGKENVPFASQQPQPAGASKPPKGKKSGIVPVHTRWQTYNLEGVPQYGYHLWDPYHQNRIKGDYPVEGKWFLEADTFQNFVYKSRRNLDFSNAPDLAKQFKAKALTFFSHNNFMDENAIFGTELRHNDDRFFPSDFRIHIDGSVDWKHDITAFLGSNHSEGHAQVFDSFADIQLHNFGEVNFNQMFLRSGLQFFKSDFHGLVFNDVGLGGRIFGNSLSNRLRYDFAVLKLFQKDAVSGFIDFSKASQHTVLISHFVYEDLFFKGWNSEWSFHWNHDPRSAVGAVPNLNLDTYYVGTTFNGHINRWIFNPAIYGVFGSADHNVGGTAVRHDVRAWTGVLDLEYPLDYWKFRLGYVYASGDGNPNSKTDTGFDSINDAVQLFGGPISYWIGENIKFGKNDFVRGNSFYPSLRGANGQADYVNPGLKLVNGGFDTTITPRLALSSNVNWLYFNNTGTFTDVKNSLTIRHHNAGVEETIFIRWKPFLHAINDLVILDFGFSELQPLGGMKDAFGSSRPVYTFQVVPRLVF